MTILYLADHRPRRPHPQPEIARCPRCHVLPGEECVSLSGFLPEGFAHPERHAAAIAAAHDTRGNPA